MLFTWRYAMSYDTKKMKRHMLAIRLAIALILTAFFIYFVFQVASEDQGDAPQQASSEGEEVFEAWMNDNLYNSQNYTLRLYLPDGCPENTLEFSALKDLPFWNWVDSETKGENTPLDIAVDRVHKTAAFSSGSGEADRLVSIRDNEVLFRIPTENGDYSTVISKDPETLHAVDSLLFLNDPGIFEPYGKTVLRPEPSPASSLQPITLERTVRSEPFYQPFLQNSGRLLERRDSLKANWSYGEHPEKTLLISGNFTYYLDTVNALLSNLPFEDDYHFRWPDSISTAPPQCHIQISYSRINQTPSVSSDF